MNIIFEGISGAGKTSIFNKVCENLEQKNIPYEKIEDLNYDTPIKNILVDIVNKAPLMNINENFNTSIYESLLLLANHHYIQEKLRNSNKICMYDRDFLSLLAYQYILLNDEYENGNEIYQIYKKLVLINLKKIDYIFYVTAPVTVCVERTEKRDNRKFSEKEIELLKSIKERFLIELADYNDKTIILDGEKNIEENADKVLRYIKKGQ